MNAVIQAPHYQPAAEFTRWLELNKRALIRRWWECTNALRAAGEQLGVQADEVEFDAFCRAQFDVSRAAVDYDFDADTVRGSSGEPL